ncbi:acetylxylan esterase [Ruania halotolerans]|uniref:acetylxylan esterase n=1 Tax=Ruania halotolerans TaxID=2897773 RepID=UPI001E47BF18|nr:acetylxylan esterase [Ruania halotolerans]UFU06265.1 acetylxylan esterase [Ruania halotolerans]
MSATSTAPPFQTWFPDAPFDATHGYQLESLLAIEAPVEPGRFDVFWRDLYADAAQVAPEPELTPSSMAGSHEMHRVTLTALGNVRIGGWVALPKERTPRVGVIYSHGYGGREEPELAGMPADAAVIFPVARGLPTASLMPELGSTAHTHVLEGIGSIHTYVLGGCAADVWASATALQEIVGVELPLAFVGASFGGGQGALAVPWDDRFEAAALKVPSFGNYDLRLELPCTGSGAAVREYVDAHPQAREVLRYFDAATAATRLQIPTLMACALWDPSVPPAGQFAVHNAARAATGDAARLQVLSAGHAEYPGDTQENVVWLRGVRELIDAVRR